MFLPKLSIANSLVAIAAKLQMITLGLGVLLAGTFLIPAQVSGQDLPKSPSTSPTFINKRVCPKDFKSLTAAIAHDLPTYLNRTYSRLGIKTQVQVVSLPELEPLPLAGDRYAKNLAVANVDPQQMFLAVLDRQVGTVQTTERAYWLFLSNTQRGWRLAMAFTRVANAPPQDVSDGAIANAVKTWLRDYCDARY